jgi:lysyl-tRNA synthetase class 2
MSDMPNWKRLKTEAGFRARMEKRAEIVGAVREFFRARDFLEVETPTVVALPGMEPHLDPFRTEMVEMNGAVHQSYLITSPEYAMKKLLAGGLPRIFEITRCYRNGEPWDGSHNPEFGMIEWYRADADYTAIMKDMEEMVADVAQKVTGSMRIVYQGMKIDLTPPWPRMTVAEAMKKFAGIDVAKGIDDLAWFRSEVEAKGCPTGADDTFDDMFFRIFLRDVEPKLGSDDADTNGVIRPLILCEYPRSMAALARLKPEDARFAERFEAYCGGMELANAFSELNDAVEQRRRLDEERTLRATLGRHVYGLDEQFIEAVGQMPKCAGIALGIDRLVMLLTDASSIRDVLFFPASDIFGQP